MRGRVSSLATSAWVAAQKSALPLDEGNYVNVMDREGESGVRRAYGANYARLQQVKAKYDPRNLFSLYRDVRPR